MESKNEQVTILKIKLPPTLKYLFFIVLKIVLIAKQVVVLLLEVKIFLAFFHQKLNCPSPAFLNFQNAHPE